MNTLFRTEWLKLRKYRAFWWLFALTAISYPGVNYIFYRAYSDFVKEQSAAAELVKNRIGNPFEFPEVWHTVAFASSIFVFIPAVLIIMFITNEYNFRTHRQNVIDGWSRNQFMAAKIIDVFLISLMIT